MSEVFDRDGLRARLRHFVLHEAVSARRAFEEGIGKSIPDRVEAGDCVDRLVRIDGNERRLRLSAPEFHAKYREDESLWLSDGEDVERGLEVKFVSWDAERKELLVDVDRWGSRDLGRLEGLDSLCLDRRELGLDRLLLEGLDTVFAPGNEHVLEILVGREARGLDEERAAKARAHAEGVGFTPAQVEGFAHAVGSDGVTLIQGPPGTGKTRLLSELALYLASLRCRVFVSAFTHRALDNLLLATRARSPKLPIFKLGQRRPDGAGLDAARVLHVSKLERLSLPPGGAVVGGTPFALRKRSSERQFHFAILDEAGQMPLVHGAMAMTAARRVIVAGDPAQLPPVAQGEYRDEQLGASLHLHLEKHRESILLDRSFRLSESLCSFVSSEFYAGRLSSAEIAAGRSLGAAQTVAETGAEAGVSPGHEEDARVDEVLAPEHALVHARIDHLGRSRRSPEEARCIADIVERVLRRGLLPSSEIAVLTPFRQQVRAVRSEVQARGLLDDALVIDTVERMQGQERELVLLSLASSDRDYLAAQAEFYFEPGRLCVAVSRARSKCIVVGSPELLRARPRELAHMMAAARVHRLLESCHAVDLSDRYVIAQQGRGA
jgi:DNA replication ATP-dependent helicase Dna2